MNTRKMRAFLIVAVIFSRACNLYAGSRADDTTITITAQTPGITPFIDQLTLVVSDTTVLKSVQFTIAPKPGSVTRPLSGTYANDYLISRGYEQPGTGQIFLPVYGLYDAYANAVTLTYHFLDGSSKQDTTTVTTGTFDDPCGYKNPTVLQRRTANTDLSYDFMLVREACDSFSPAILDTDGALRWVGTVGNPSLPATFFDNAVYFATGPHLYRVDLDGTATLLADYSSIGVVYFHHNIDRGKTGVILDASTAAYVDSLNIEVDAAGTIIKQWNMADIISAAMVAGGDNPSQFVAPAPNDWFHNNGVTYNRADNSLIVSSRENFLICIDYDTNAIKWILGDPTKKWHEFSSLRNYALSLASGSLPPIGQHAPSITYDQDIIVFDNGEMSLFEVPPGEQRTYASPRKYSLDLGARVATEVWNYPMGESIFNPFCGSSYEDAPFNYLVDYAFVTSPMVPTPYAQLLGLNAAGERIFYYQYPTVACNTAYNSIPLHLEDTAFPTVGPRALNLATRGTVGSGDGSLIGGFIISGTSAKDVALRVLGPSLSDSGLTGVVADPALTLYDSSRAVIATNDNWESDPRTAEILADGLAPANAAEAATIQSLSPGAYTVAATSVNGTSGIGLVEIYDLSPSLDSKLANLSTRGLVGTGDNVLIGGFIVGDVASSTIIVRALGPSLASAGVGDPLSDPTLTIYDGNGVAIATNDNWRDDTYAADISLNGLAPTADAESATILHLPAGSYTTVISGVGGATGVGLVEVYNLN